MSVPIATYPLKLSSLPKEKLWGGYRISDMFGLPKLHRQPVGEVWAIWDDLFITNGSLAGQKLKDIVIREPLSVLGSAVVAMSDAVFPLLVKFIGAKEPLSVQIHPDDLFARDVERQPFGKCEMWYVIHATDAAEIIYGIREPYSPGTVKMAVASGKIVELLNRVPVVAGDVILIRPGTIHALGGGLVVYELQQSCDLTYRIYDWDRNPDGGRDLQIDKAIAVLDSRVPAIGKINPIRLDELGYSRIILAACKYFAAEVRVIEQRMYDKTADERFHILTVLSGSGLISGGSLTSAMQISYPESILIPASLREYELTAQGGPMSIIKAYVPDLISDIVQPLRERGIGRDSIIQLGGDAIRSELNQLI